MGKQLTILFLFVLSVFVFVTLAQSQETKIINEKGIPVVYNPKTPVKVPNEPKGLHLEENITIGQQSTKEEPLFYRIRAIQVDDNENIYILDNKACQIKTFDSESRLKNTFGMKGQGPGEMHLPWLINLTLKNQIMLYDVGNRRISLFSLDGTHLNDVSTASTILLNLVSILKDGSFIGTDVIYKGDKSVYEFNKYDSSFKKKLTISSVERPYDRNILRFFQPRIFFRAFNNGNVLWGNDHSYVLHITNSEGIEIKRICREYDSIKITEEDKKREIEMRIGEQGPPAGTEMKFPSHFPVFDHFHICDEGRIYVRTYEKSKDGGIFYDVFDSFGRYIIKVSLKTTLRVIRKNKLYSVEENQEGMHLVKIYNLKWEY
ncbi:MAG: 6-bladed beta-propeller [Candidatus Aminicenantes bacterium]|nr:6-bladed beta-propeller [Candidatus Aminicenantes bacterium]